MGRKKISGSVHSKTVVMKPYVFAEVVDGTVPGEPIKVQAFAKYNPNDSKMGRPFNEELGKTIALGRAMKKARTMRMARELEAAAAEVAVTAETSAKPKRKYTKRTNTITVNA